MITKRAFKGNKRKGFVFGLFILFLIIQFIGSHVAFADELEVKEDMTVDGTGGTENNPNVWVKGYIE
mgnify:CR=1 FL=1